jgi:hypothetical protein
VVIAYRQATIALATRSPTWRTAGCSTGAVTRTCSERSPGYRRLLTAYEHRGETRPSPGAGRRAGPDEGETEQDIEQAEMERAELEQDLEQG